MNFLNKNINAQILDTNVLSTKDSKKCIMIRRLRKIYTSQGHVIRHIEKEIFWICECDSL